MKKYDSYKDSGIEWIGEIPSHWEVKKLNWCFEFIGSGTTPKADNQLYYLDGDLNWLLTGDLNDGEIYDTTKKITQKAIDDYSILKVYPTESIVMAMYGATIGKLGVLKIETTVNQACCVLSKPSYLNHKFAFYVLLAARSEILNMSYGGGQPNISQELIKSFKVQIPPIAEQTAIANFLDLKTSEIDEIIVDKKRLLELYEEEKTAIINKAVTKGINPDAPMKDSGIEWLGEIPEHWEVKRLKYYFDLITEKAQDNEDILKVGLENIESKTGKFIESNSDFAGIGVLFKENDILFGKLRPYLAKVWLSNMDGQAVGDFYVLRSKNVVSPEFAKYRILDSSFIEITNSSTYGSKMPRVSWEFISDLPIAFPPIQDQQLIVHYIESECSKIDFKKARTEELIGLLTEYRTALINEVVTGKIKVME